MEINKSELIGNSTNQPQAEKVAAAFERAQAETGGGDEFGSSTPSTANETPRAQAIKAAARAMDEANKANEEGGEADAEPAQPAKPRAKRTAPAEETPAEEIGISEVVQERRRLRHEHEQRSRKLNQTFAAREQQINTVVARLAPLAEAADMLLEHGDLDGFARALGQFKGDADIKDWDTLEREAKMLAFTPHYKDLRKLRADQRQRDEAQRRQQAQAQQQAQHQQRAYQEQQRAAQEQQWVASIADDLTSDEDSAVAEIIGVDPEFAQHVLGTQRHHHAQSGKVLPAREAAVQVLGRLYKNWAGWRSYFEKHEKSAFMQRVVRAGSASAGTPKRPAPQRQPGQALPKPPPAKPSAAATSQKRRDELMKQFAPGLGEAMRREGRG